MYPEGWFFPGTLTVTILQMGKARTLLSWVHGEGLSGLGLGALTHRALGLSGVSVLSDCPSGAECYGVLWSLADRQPLEGSHTRQRGRLAASPSGFPAGPGPRPPGMVSCYCFFVRAGLAVDRQALWWAAPSVPLGCPHGGLALYLPGPQLQASNLVL